MATNPACKTFIPLLSPFIDGELPPAQRETVERHLAACHDCTGRVADLRAESGLVRYGMELLADEADFTGFAQKVMARVTPERPPLLERLRLGISELFLYQRGALVTAAATVMVVVLAGLLFLRDRTPTGYANDRIVVQEVSVDQTANVKPVVTTTEDGNTIIWLMSEPEEKKKSEPRKTDDEESEEELGGPSAAPLNPDGSKPQGGEL